MYQSVLTPCYISFGAFDSLKRRVTSLCSWSLCFGMCQNGQIARPSILLTLELKSQIRGAIKPAAVQGIQKETY